MFLVINTDINTDVDIWKWLFVTTIISQGDVATRLRCGGQCDSQFVANFSMNSTMEKFRKSVNICQSYEQKYRGPFLTHSVHTLHWQASLVSLYFSLVSRIPRCFLGSVVFWSSATRCVFCTDNASYTYWHAGRQYKREPVNSVEILSDWKSLNHNTFENLYSPQMVERTNTITVRKKLLMTDALHRLK